MINEPDCRRCGQSAYYCTCVNTQTIENLEARCKRYRDALKEIVEVCRTGPIAIVGDIAKDALRD